MVAEKVITLVMVFNLVGIDTFQTEKCEHGELITAIRKLGKCMMKEYDAGVNYDICTPFEWGRECVTDNLKDCFVEEDLETILKNRLASIRNTLTQLTLIPMTYFHN